MKYLFKQVQIVDVRSPFHNQSVDLLLEDGVIKSINNGIEDSDAQVISKEGMYASIGWMDLGVQACDPGLEYREDLHSMSAAAAAGGFTAVAVYPNTHPVVHSKSEVLYIKNISNSLLIDCLPIGAVSHACNGKDITEMLDMHAAGAIAFSDGEHSIQNGGMLTRALQYVRAFDGIVINYPYNHSISPAGQIHEGLISTQLGLRGIPSIAEELMVQRDLQLVKYAESKLHFAGISTALSVDLIRRAKQEGVNVTASVGLNNLVFTHEALSGFNSNLKVLPPLRSEEDVLALKQGLKDGTIDFISTFHMPQVEDEKKLEFPYAAFGATGLQTALGGSLIATEGVLSLEELIEKWTYTPRSIFGLEIPIIEEGALANLTVFCPDEEWLVDPLTLKSRSKNNPFIHQNLKGKILATANKQRVEIFPI